MIHWERIKQIVASHGLTHLAIANEYIKMNGEKKVSKNYITGLLNGTEEINENNYQRLMDAINSANKNK